MKDNLKPILIIIISSAIILGVIVRIIYDLRNRNIPPRSTGAIPEELPIEEQNYLIKFANLRDMCPVATDQFTIKFDYASNEFDIYISEPYKDNKQSFSDWLVKNDFDNISNDKFDFKTIGGD